MLTNVSVFIFIAVLYSVIQYFLALYVFNFWWTSLPFPSSFLLPFKKLLVVHDYSIGILSGCRYIYILCLKSFSTFFSPLRFPSLQLLVLFPFAKQIYCHIYCYLFFFILLFVYIKGFSYNRDYVKFKFRFIIYFT